MRCRPSWCPAMALLILPWASTTQADEPTGWKKHEINARSVFEGAGAFDVDNDGKLDVVSGETWYKGPDWTAYPVRKVSKSGTYRNCFSTLPIDVNGDGRIDFITCSYFEKNVGWVENPGVPGQEWTYHEIDKPGNSEAAVLVDLDGDGKPDVLPNSVNTVAWYSLESASSQPSWKKHDFGTLAAGHGIGSGDINRDGRLDLLTPKGWFEAPADPKTAATWTWHPDWNLGATGIQILAKDLDGDGKVELVFGMGHDRGLFWAKQEIGADGKFTWIKKSIDPTLSSVHVLSWVDLDGDGKTNELLSGKRVYAHEIEAGDIEPSQVAYYQFDLYGADLVWRKHLIFRGEHANASTPKEGGKRDAQKDFPAGTAGTGLEVPIVDLDGDGDLDLVCPGKSGLYWFENPLRSALAPPK